MMRYNRNVSNECNSTIIAKEVSMNGSIKALGAVIIKGELN
jgi:hypothetical protein